MRSLLQEQELSYSPYKDMLDVLSTVVTVRGFGPVGLNATKESHDAGWRSDRAPTRRQEVLVAAMLGADLSRRGCDGC